MKNLVIDQGNTYSKWAIFDDDAIIAQGRTKNSELTTLRDNVAKHNITKGLIASVSNASQLIALLSERNIEARIVTKDYKWPIEIAYLTPETLGIDRLIAAVGAWKISPKTNNLIIDLGTCITYDMATPSRGYIGGNIAPGLDMRLKAMHQFTNKLPLLDRSMTSCEWGQNTEEAIRNGAQIGIKAEIEHHRGIALKEYEKISVFLTGGDAYFFEKMIKNGIFVNSNLLLIGLNEILKLNNNQNESV